MGRCELFRMFSRTGRQSDVVPRVIGKVDRRSATVTMAAQRDRRRSKNLGHTRWPGHRIALEPHQRRKGRTRPTAAHAAMTVMHRFRHAFGFPTHPATKTAPSHCALPWLTQIKIKDRNLLDHQIGLPTKASRGERWLRSRPGSKPGPLEAIHKPA